MTHTSLVVTERFPGIRVDSVDRLIDSGIDSGALPWLFPQLDPVTRLRVLAGLGILLVAAGFLLLFIRATARATRWYINRPLRRTVLQGDPFRVVIDAKPRPWHRERENWQRRR